VWISVRWCRVGPFRVRVCLPGSVCKVEAARPWWNKVLRPFLHFAIACSGDGDGVVRLELAGSGDRVGAPVPVSSCTGVCSSTFQPCMVWGAAEFYRGLAVGLLGVWWLVRFLFPASRRQKRWIHGGRSLGCVPSRCASVIRFCCGSCKSLRAMELLLTWASRSLSSLPCSVDGHGGVRGRRATTLASTKDLLGLFVFFCFCKVFCVRWCGQLSPLYSSSRCLYWFSTVYNFDMV